MLFLALFVSSTAVVWGYNGIPESIIGNGVDSIGQHFNITQSCLGDNGIGRNKHSETIVLNARDWDTQVTSTWVAAIILQEVMGYNLSVNTYVGDTNGVFDLLNQGSADVDVEVWGINVGGASYSSFQEMILSDAIIDLGQLGVEAIESWYISTQSVQQWTDAAVGKAPEYYRSWEGSDLIQQLIDDNAWNVSDAMRRDSNGDYVCDDDWGCDDGFYYPPQCESNPESHCALMYHVSPEWDENVTFTLPVSLDLNVSVAFIDYSAFSDFVYSRIDRNETSLFYWWEPDSLTAAHCGSDKCWTRFILPTASVECHEKDRYPVGYDMDCGWTTDYLQKLGSPRLSQLSDLIPAKQMLTKMMISNADYDAMMLYDGSIHDKACAWVQNHSDVWSAWIPADAECQFDDIDWSVSQCAQSGVVRTVGYQWTQPKSCEGGITLPNGDDVACDSISPHSGLGIGLLCCVCLLALAMVWCNVMLYINRSLVCYRMNIPTPTLERITIANAISIAYLLFSIHSMHNTTTCAVDYFGYNFAHATSVLCFSTILHRVSQQHSGEIILRSAAYYRKWFIGYTIGVFALLCATHFVDQTTVRSIDITTKGGATIADRYCGFEKEAIFWVWTAVGLGGFLGLLSTSLQMYKTKYLHLKTLPLLITLYAISFCLHEMMIPSRVLSVQALLLIRFWALFIANIACIVFLHFTALGIMKFGLVIPANLGKFDSESFNLPATIDTAAADGTTKILYDFQAFAQDPVLQTGLVRFMKKQFCGENAEFIAAVTSYSNFVRRKYVTDDAKRDRCQEIIDSFIKVGSELEINISNRLRSTLIKNVKTSCSKKEVPLSQVFDDALSDVKKMIEHNYAQRFFASDDAQEAMDVRLWTKNFASLETDQQSSVLRRLHRIHRRTIRLNTELETGGDISIETGDKIEIETTVSNTPIPIEMEIPSPSK